MTLPALEGGVDRGQSRETGRVRDESGVYRTIAFSRASHGRRCPKGGLGNTL
jgi:hypothetical protein